MSGAIRQVTIRGRVQGVGYRAWVEHRARAHGLEGWVRNRRDGSVEALFAGPEKAAHLLNYTVLAALHARVSSGQGQMVDTSLFEAGITHTYWHSAIYFATGQVPGPMGTAHPLNAPYQAFPASDGPDRGSRCRTSYR